jgi:hypothetical protein
MHKMPKFLSQALGKDLEFKVDVSPPTSESELVIRATNILELDS